MFDRAGRDAMGQLVTGSRARSVARHRLQIEPLEGRAMMTASLSPISNITVPQYEGYQVPLVGGTTHDQTYTVTSDNPGVKVSIAQGKFLTIGVTHNSSGANDPAFSGTMTYQLFDDLTPNATAMIESLVNGTATGLASGVTIGSDYYVGKIFHRVANEFPGPTDYIVQGGSLNGDGTGSVFATPFPDELNSQLAFTGAGQLALANSGNDTNDSQFFVTTGAPTFLNYKYTLFGQLVDGQTIVNDMTKVAVGGTSNTTPTDPITITSATLSTSSPDGVIHVDTSVAPANSVANVTVTAKDVTDNSTASQTFQVGVVAPNTTSPNPPFLGPYDQTISVGENQVATFQLSAVSTVPGAQLTYTVEGGTTSSTTNGTTTETFTPVSNATATVSSTGLVSVTPTTGYTGTISLLVGVRDQTNRAGSGVALDSPSNYETHMITLNVASSTTAVALRPLSQQATIAATTSASTPIQLFSSNPNNTETEPLTYTLNSQPTHGTITGFNATTGKLSYTPTAGYLGPDAFTYTVNDPNNTNTSTNTSFPTTININVDQASTGAVRFFADDLSTSTTVPGVLVITPPVSTTNGNINTIGVTEVGGNVQVTLNGVVDILQPAASNVDSITIYGAKANDNVTVDPSITMPVLLSGGTGGTNVLKGGGGPTTELGYYGKNTLIQGSGQNFQFGKTGRVTIVKGSGTSNVIFIGKPGGFRTTSKVYHLPSPPTGTFYTFEGDKLVKTSNPFSVKATKTTNLKVATASVNEAKISKTTAKK